MASTVMIRESIEDDVETCGRVIFTAFKVLADRHGVSPDFPSADAASTMVRALCQSPTVQGFVAERDGRLVGCTFIDSSPPVGGIGPVAVLPEMQAKGVGRDLMRAAIERASVAGVNAVRLNQSAYNTASLSLYIKLGFDARLPISVMQGVPPRYETRTHHVRPLGMGDIPACEGLCHATFGFERLGEVRAAMARRSAMVVEADDSVVGYTTGIGFDGHAVAADHHGLKALISAAPSYAGPGFLLPTSNTEVVRWCLENGLRVAMQMTYMSMGIYGEPAGHWLPSILR